ncbi:phenylalanine--tRNA ligase subunit alpha [Candidatus Parcubacteria bacterium]|nr:phenylalanine--tRNA ligase subunit alpha [Candidatus Parcubacteria bacterium]
MKDEIIKIKEEILAELKKVKESEALGNLETKYLGRKGKLTVLLKQIAGLSDEEKKEIGRLANQTKKEMISKFKEIKSVISGKGEDTFVDVTLPGEKRVLGHLHPVTIVQNELEDLFKSMGFMVLDGPELESDYFNFEALNIPSHHPARDMQDTFYVATPHPNPLPHPQPLSFARRGESKERGQEETNVDQSDMVMRTHTSPVQVRGMLKYGAPLRCVAPGRVFRAEAIDAVHEHTFDQMEGLMVDENISISNLIAVMKELINGIFGREVETRVRPGYFPFVEPGIELDIKCTICNGSGCPGCKHSGWLEILPAGQVHPKVLEYGGIDPDKYSGFAFGLGLTRLAMMKYKINDTRLFNSGDLRFLRQF